MLEILDARLVNTSEFVTIPCLLRLDQTRLKIDQSISRCFSGNRVFRPNRLMPRYASHVFNCQASTTSSHSVIRK